MSTDTAKIRSKLTKLNKSLDDLESQLEPLFTQSLPETLLALDTIQQAKLQVIIPYVIYDLAFVYLKSRGIDPKTHRVVAELERVREYFDKIKRAEESDQKRKLGIDKEAATRFIKHAIAQAKNAQSGDEPSDDTVPVVSSSSSQRVPVRVTSKMIARAEYEKELRELEGEEEDDLEVFDEAAAVEDEDAMDTEDSLPQGTMSMTQAKGKGRASEEEQSKDEQIPSAKRKISRVDPFSGYGNLSASESAPQTVGDDEEVKLSAPRQSLSAISSSRGTPASISEDQDTGKAAKKARRKAKKPRST